MAKLDPVSGKVLRETLHGHNYKVVCEVTGPKQAGSSPYIIDKNDIQDAAKRVCDSFHSKMLIPTKSPALIVQDFFPDKDHVTMRIKNANEVFQFPRKDALLLDIEYTSIEDLAELMTKLIYGELAKKGAHVTSNIQQLKVSVQEYPGLKCVRCLELGLSSSYKPKL